MPTATLPPPWSASHLLHTRDPILHLEEVPGNHVVLFGSRGVPKPRFTWPTNLPAWADPKPTSGRTS